MREAQEGKRGSTDAVQEKGIVPLGTKKRNATLSREELEFFCDAKDAEHLCLTHFAAPGAEFCHCCPLCYEVINWGNPPQSARTHFEIPPTLDGRRSNIGQSQGDGNYPTEAQGGNPRGGQPTECGTTSGLRHGDHGAQ